MLHIVLRIVEQVILYRNRNSNHISIEAIPSHRYIESILSSLFFAQHFTFDNRRCKQLRTLFELQNVIKFKFFLDKNINLTLTGL